MKSKYTAVQGIPAIGVKAGQIVPGNVDEKLIARYLRRGWLIGEEVQDDPVVPAPVADVPAPQKRGRKAKQ